jgi:hypothetical protein
MYSSYKIIKNRLENVLAVGMLWPNGLRYWVGAMDCLPDDEINGILLGP